MEVNTLTILLSALVGGGGSGGLLLGNSYPLSAGYGSLFTLDGNQFARNNIVVTDNNLLDPILQAQKSYAPSGGQNTFSQALGTVVASTVNNPNGTVLVFTYNDTTTFRSVDNGENYTSLVLPSASYAGARDSAAVSPVTGTLIVNSILAGRVQRSTDDGQSFTNIITGASLGFESVFCASDGIWYAGNSNKNIYKSIDDGLNWTVASPAFSAQGTTLCEAAGNRVVIGFGNGDILYTDNQGDTWTQATGTLSGVLQAISYIGNDGVNDVVIAVSPGANGNGISYDNGATWQAYPEFNQYGNGGGQCKNLWSDGNGALIAGMFDQDYDGTKDRAVLVTSKDFGVTTSIIGYVETESLIGLSQGANGRLFASGTTYDAANSPDPYVYLDQGYKGGTGDPNLDTWATCIKKGV